MNILVVAATPLELSSLLRHLTEHYPTLPDGSFDIGSVQVRTIATGIGPVATAFALGTVLATAPPDLAINMGIAGALDDGIGLGTVVHVVSERFADLGIEEQDGSFHDLFEIGLMETEQPPFTRKRLLDPRAQHAAFLPQAHGITVSKVHGSAASIASVRARYPDAQVESMEGAAFFYACLLAEVPFMQVRGVSNKVEPRNRANWKIKEAVESTTNVVLDILRSF
jgi:futalosine hydrolase